MCIVAAGAGTVRCVIFVRDMHESNIQNIHDMLVVEGVKNVFALPAAFDQLVLLQNFQQVQLYLFHSLKYIYIPFLSPNNIIQIIIIKYNKKYKSLQKSKKKAKKKLATSYFC